MRAKDLRLLQDASAVISELGVDLDRKLDGERRPAERLRMLREATNGITRTANDAVQAYTRASRAVSAELARPNGDDAAAQETRILLDAARREILRVLEIAQRRYPWHGAGNGSGTAGSETSDRQ